MARGADVLTSSELGAIRRSRRHPTITQHDYLHLRRLVEGLRAALARVPEPVQDVLDVWCGSRPYEDLLPPSATCVGLDVEGNRYGVADVVSDTLLPFPDESFDLVTCIQAFQFIHDPRHAISEFARVLRHGGSALVTLVFAFEYDPGDGFEARYTEHQLRELFSEWDDVWVHEDGGRAVSWTVLTGSLLFGLEQRIGRRLDPRAAHAALAPAYAAVNVLGLGLDRLEARGKRAASLPMNITLLARKPARA